MTVETPAHVPQPGTGSRSGPPGLPDSSRQAARIGGGSYLIMFVLAIFANFVVRENLIESGDPAATVANITGSIGLFRLGLISFLVIFILDVVISWALYVVFRETNPDLSLAAAWFRLVYTALLGVALVSLFEVLEILTQPAALGLVGADQINAETMMALASFESMWRIGLTAFGIHLILVGVLIRYSGVVSKMLGYILMAAGMAYVFDTIAYGLLTDYQDVEALFQAAVALPSVVGEGWLGFWLLLTRKLPT